MNKQSQTKMSIDRPHGRIGKHVDIITTLPEINGSSQIKVDQFGNVTTPKIRSGKPSIILK
jgi:hypothetical protein|tara:strand:- start:814 stop:996 length:183 start_codon:yes stop_codon:yes gene_type:complete